MLGLRRSLNSDSKWEEREIGREGEDGSELLGHFFFFADKYKHVELSFDNKSRNDEFILEKMKLSCLKEDDI